MSLSRAKLALVVSACLVVVSMAQQSSPRPADDNGPTWDRFRVLVDRNIFLRSRTRPRPPGRDQSTPSRVVRDPNADLVLVGTTQQGSAAIAFIENIRTGEVRRVTVNEAVGTGRITAITLDDITYSLDGVDTEIAIGRALGRAASAIAGVAPTEAPTLAGAAAATPGESSDADTTDILERMRRQRQQELDQ